MGTGARSWAACRPLRQIASWQGWSMGECWSNAGWPDTGWTANPALTGQQKRPPLTNMSGGLPLPIKHQYCLYRSSHRKYCLCPHSAAGACPELAPEETPSQAFLSLLPMTIKPQDARCSKTALYFEAGTPMPLAVTTAGYVWSSVSICVGYQTVSFPGVSYPEACFQMDTAKPPFCVYVRSKGTVVVTSS